MSSNAMYCDKPIHPSRTRDILEVIQTLVDSNDIEGVRDALTRYHYSTHTLRTYSKEMKALLRAHDKSRLDLILAVKTNDITEITRLLPEYTELPDYISAIAFDIETWWVLRGINDSIYALTRAILDKDLDRVIDLARRVPIIDIHAIYAIKTSVPDIIKAVLGWHRQKIYMTSDDEDIEGLIRYHNRYILSRADIIDARIRLTIAVQTGCVSDVRTLLDDGVIPIQEHITEALKRDNIEITRLIQPRSY